MSIAIISFYSFVTIENPNILLSKLLYYGKRKNIKGTILLANEGFNGSIAGSRELLESLIEIAKEYTNATNINIKINYASYPPFNKFKVKLKKEIVTLGQNIEDINSYKGKYIDTHDWDNFIKDPNVIVIDTRNNYEIIEGTFSNSINPLTESFRQFPLWFEKNKEKFHNKKIAMFCTGGIRCEKSTAYLRLLGFKEVYHLKGGILQYLEDTKNPNQLWQGTCFVFDERKILDQDLAPC